MKKSILLGVTIWASMAVFGAEDPNAELQRALEENERLVRANQVDPGPGQSRQIKVYNWQRIPAEAWFLVAIAWFHLLGAGLTAYVAGEKGYNGLWWFVLYLFTSLLALIAAAGLPDRRPRPPLESYRAH